MWRRADNGPARRQIHASIGAGSQIWALYPLEALCDSRQHLARGSGAWLGCVDHVTGAHSGGRRCAIGRAIQSGSRYGTRPGPIQGEPWCRNTRKENTIFLHVLDWPKDGKVCVNWVGATKAYFLHDANGKALPLPQASGQLVIEGPRHAPDLHVTVIVLEQDL